VVDFYHYRTGISGYNENLHKTTQIKTKIKKSSLKIILTQKKWTFYCLGTEKMPELFSASLALGRDPLHASSLKLSVSVRDII
jgi:hypothetical protein